MRFISPHRGYSACIRPPVQIFDKYGQPQVAERELTAEFDLYKYTREWEVELAERELVFKGMPVEEHTGEPLPVVSRVSVFDSEEAQERLGWTDEERQAVETKLIKWQRPEDHLLAVKPPAPLPWPKYTEQRQPLRIRKMVEEFGLSPATVLEYEKENENRPEVIKALTELAEEQALATDREIVVKA